MPESSASSVQKKHDQNKVGTYSLSGVQSAEERVNKEKTVRREQRVAELERQIANERGQREKLRPELDALQRMIRHLLMNDAKTEHSEVKCCKDRAVPDRSIADAPTSYTLWS